MSWSEVWTVGSKGAKAVCLAWHHHCCCKELRPYVKSSVFCLWWFTRWGSLCKTSHLFLSEASMVVEMLLLSVSPESCFDVWQIETLSNNWQHWDISQASVRKIRKWSWFHDSPFLHSVLLPVVLLSLCYVNKSLLGSMPWNCSHLVGFLKGRTVPTLYRKGVST